MGCFYYDQLNRLTAATGTAFTEQGITYDKNSNIKSLQRTANNLTIENLSYAYSGNKLSSVNESVTGGMTSSYTYDANGNLAADSKKALNFSYNFLNLVQAAGTTNYCYAADGTKLAVRDAGGNGFAYIGSLILSPSSTEFQFSDGVIRKTTSGYEVNYFLCDHLGSVRTVVNAAGEVVQQSDYYPFGSKHENANYVNNSNRFLYNGKELQTTGNLGFLDYGARMYDAKLGRFFTQDRFSEKYTNLSQYQYGANNPICNIDVNGDSVVLFLNTEVAYGFGHMAMAYQDEQENWFYFSQGQAGDKSAISLFSASNDYGGVDNIPVINVDINKKVTSDNIIKTLGSGLYGYEFNEYIILGTTKEQDKNIKKGADEITQMHNSGDLKYNIYTNNCSDAVINSIEKYSGVQLPPKTSPIPKVYFESLKKSLK